MPILLATPQPGISGVLTRLAATLAAVDETRHALALVLNATNSPEHEALDTASHALQQAYDTLRQRVPAA